MEESVIVCLNLLPTIASLCPAEGDALWCPEKECQPAFHGQLHCPALCTGKDGRASVDRPRAEDRSNDAPAVQAGTWARATRSVDIEARTDEDGDAPGTTVAPRRGEDLRRQIVPRVGMKSRTSAVANAVEEGAPAPRLTVGEEGVDGASGGEQPSHSV